MIGRRCVLTAFIGVAVYAGPAFAQDSVQSIYQAAQREGRMVVWSSLDIDLQHELARAFNKKYSDIKIEPFRIQPGPAVERAITESRAGRTEVDALDMNIAYLPLMLDRGLIDPYSWTKTLGVDSEQVSFDDRAVVYEQYDLPIAYNTDLAKPAEIQSWEDVLNPKWTGKIILEGRGFPFSILASKWGIDKTRDYIQRLLALKPIIVKGGQAAAEALAGGQGAIAIGAYGARIELYKKAGAPVDWARVGPVPAQLVVIVVPKTAEHPNAARLWASFLTTPEAQRITYENQGYGIVKGGNLSPRGLEMQRHGLDVVLEPIDVELGRRQLEAVGRVIGTIQ